MVLQKANRELAVVLPLTWLHIDVILRMDANFFYQILPFLGPCFPTTTPIVFDTNFIFESFWVQIFTPKETMLLEKLRKGLKGKKWW